MLRKSPPTYNRDFECGTLVALGVTPAAGPAVDEGQEKLRHTCTLSLHSIFVNCPTCIQAVNKVTNLQVAAEFVLP